MQLVCPRTVRDDDNKQPVRWLFALQILDLHSRGLALEAPRNHDMRKALRAHARDMASPTVASLAAKFGVPATLTPSPSQAPRKSPERPKRVERGEKPDAGGRSAKGPKTAANRKGEGVVGDAMNLGRAMSGAKRGGTHAPERLTGSERHGRSKSSTGVERSPRSKAAAEVAGAGAPGVARGPGTLGHSAGADAEHVAGPRQDAPSAVPVAAAGAKRKAIWDTRTTERASGVGQGPTLTLREADDGFMAKVDSKRGAKKAKGPSTGPSLGLLKHRSPVHRDRMPHGAGAAGRSDGVQRGNGRGVRSRIEGSVGAEGGESGGASTRDLLSKLFDGS